MWGFFASWWPCMKVSRPCAGWWKSEMLYQVTAAAWPAAWAAWWLWKDTGPQFPPAGRAQCLRVSYHTNCCENALISCETQHWTDNFHFNLEVVSDVFSVLYEAQCFSCCSHRESPSQTHDLTETADEESEDHHPQDDHHDLNHNNYFDMLNAESVEPAPPPPPLNPKFGSINSIHENCVSPSQALPSPDSCLLKSAKSKLSKSKRDNSDLLQGIGTHSTIKRALLRSSRARRDIKAENIFAPTKYSDEREREQQTQESFSSSSLVEKEESAVNQETVLLGYDAQWCWVESQDDVTFLWAHLQCIIFGL